MHLVTAYHWACDTLKPIQLEYPDPPGVFDDFLRYNGFLNKETYHVGTSSPLSCCDPTGDISINVYQAEPQTTTEFDCGPRFLASLDIAHNNVLILLDSPVDYISFLNAYSPLLTLALLRVIQKDLGRLTKGLNDVEHLNAMQEMQAGARA